MEDRPLFWQFRWPTGDLYKFVRTSFIDPTEMRTTRILTSGVALGAASESHDYMPLQSHGTLYRQLADLKTEQDIIDFADSFGSLTRGKLITLPNGKTRRRQLVGMGEEVEFWYQNIQAMRRAVCLWDAIKNRDDEALNKMIQWKGNDRVIYIRYTPRFRIQIIASKRRRPLLLKQFTPGDLIAPAKSLVQDWTNQGMDGQVSPRLLQVLPPQETELKEFHRLGMYIVPQSLIGALWLQLALAIDGNKEYRKCENGQCSELIEISLDPSGRRVDRVFCSPRCKMQVQRDKEKEAISLFHQGWSYPRIAKKLGSKPSIIEGWVKKKSWKSATQKTRKQLTPG